MVLLLRILIFTLCSFAFCTGKLTAKYCGLKVKTTSLLNSGYSDSNVFLTSTDSRMADSVIYKGNPIAQQFPGNNGVFIRPPEDIISSFCQSGGEYLKSADVNGDGRDDLVCHNAVTGEVKVMMRENNGYTEPQLFAHKGISFICIGDIEIGDFDGNNADDFLCVTKVTSSVPCSTYTIYFNQGCQSRHRESSHLHHQDHRGKVNYRPMFTNEYSIGPMLPYQYHGCNPNLPLFKKQIGAFPCDADLYDIRPGDIDGDGKDDLIMHDTQTSGSTARQVLYYVSNPTSLSHVFSNQLTSGMTCAPNRKLFVDDVDGDGTNELICVGDDVENSDNLPQVATYTRNGFDPVLNFYDECSQPAFCKGDDFVFPTAALFLGDFNNDGRTDVLCRYTGNPFPTGPIYSEIVFAEPV